MSSPSVAIAHEQTLPKLGRSAVFWVCLLLGLWFFLDGLWERLFGIAGLLPLVPALLMAVLGFGLLALRRSDPAACLLSLYLLALAVLARDNTAGLELLPAFAGGVVVKHPGSYRAINIVWPVALMVAPLMFAGLVTREEVLPRRTADRVRLVSLIAVITLIQAAYAFFAWRGAYGVPPLRSLTQDIDSAFHRLLVYTAPAALAAQVAAFGLLLRYYRRWGEGGNLTLVVFFGLTTLFVACVIIGDSLVRPGINLISILLAYLIPVVLIYGVERYALFDIHVILRRVVQYALARQVLAAMVMAPLFALAFLVGLSWNSNPRLPGAASLFRSVMLTEGTTICFILTIIFVLMLALRAPLLRWFDRAYFREVYDAQNLLGEVGRSLLTLSDLAEIGRVTLEGIDSVLHPTTAMLISEESGGIVCLAHRNYTGYRPPLWPEPILLSPNRLLEVPDFDRPLATRHGSGIDAWPVPARNLLREAAIRLIVPLREGERTTAALLLGEKASGLPYTPEDRDVLQALSSQVALAMQSARLNREFLQRRTQELTTGSVGFVEMVEQQRRLLAADLHDQTLPELRCLLTDLQSLADAQTPASDAGSSSSFLLHPSSLPNGHMTVPEMAEHLRQTIQNIRDMMESLRPSTLEVLGLIPALEGELRKAAGQARPPLVPQFQAAEQAVPQGLSPFAEMSVFRIVQESVNNACRHSGAKTVLVKIDLEGRDWRVCIDDDGQGLPPENQRRRGRGLDNLRYRANLINARIAWCAPEWGKGTRVELRLSLPPTPSKS